MKLTFTKTIISLFFIMVMGYSFAQSPQAFNYQAVARDFSGNILANNTLSIKVTLHIGSATGAVVYSEEFAPITNEFGLFTLAIGTGTTLSGNFSTIVWSSGNYWLQVEMDPDGGSTYTDMGTSQLLSVPYAMYAENSNNLPTGTSGQTLRNDGAEWVANSLLFNNGSKIGIGTTSPSFMLDLQATTNAYMNIQTTGAGNGGVLLDRSGTSTLIRIIYRTAGTNYWAHGLFGANNDFSISKNQATDDGTFHIAHASGYVGIGTITPGASLHIKQTTPNRAIRFEHESNTNYWNIGIGLSTMNCKFEYNGLGMGHISSVDGTYSTISDRRLKKDITPSSSLLDKVKLLNVYDFYYVSQESKGNKTRGFIAQEVEDIFPDLVSVSDEGYKLISYSNFSVVAIKAIQEQQGEIELLKQQIELMKQEIELLKNK